MKRILALTTFGFLLLLALRPPSAAIGAASARSPEALAAYLETNGSEPSPELDALCAQRDCWASQLYWHTDLDRAREAASSSGRPILSLRLLGRLAEELSCANSRLFRTVLYPDPEVRALLAGDFVLHWASERPAPRIEVDMGDGRKIVRTVTGNSIHYVLDGDGRVLDALPGLYGPRPFASALRASLALARQVAGADPAALRAALGAYHGARAAREPEPRRALAGGARAEAYVPALKAMPIAQSKMRMEASLTRQIASAPRAAAARLDLGPAVRAGEAADANDAADDAHDADDAAMAAAALTPEHVVVLSAPSRALISRHNPALAGEALERMIANLERSIAIDSLRNESRLRPRIHAWLARSGPGLGLEALNRLVYTELFLTPAADPWLGLVAPDTYAALPDNGLVTPETR